MGDRCSYQQQLENHRTNDDNVIFLDENILHLIRGLSETLMPIIATFISIRISCF